MTCEIDESFIAVVCRIDDEVDGKQIVESIEEICSLPSLDAYDQSIKTKRTNSSIDRLKESASITLQIEAFDTTDLSSTSSSLVIGH